jgi:hypothetical protein
MIILVIRFHKSSDSVRPPPINILSNQGRKFETEENLFSTLIYVLRPWRRRRHPLVPFTLSLSNVVVPWSRRNRK